MNRRRITDIASRVGYRLSVVLLFGCLATGCTTIAPNHRLSQDSRPERFSHEDFDQVVRKYVNAEGRVNYRALKGDRQQFDRYYGQIASFSPDSTPSAFHGPSDELAYWINAYNAAVIATVLTYYPISGIEEVQPPLALFFLPDKTGFFLFQKPGFGGSEASLYYLENSVIRERFSEPRVHFALNCASRGCPRLPQYAFQGDQLEQQLNRETRRFFAEPRNFRIDHEQKKILVSSILEWYEEDFLDWLRKNRPAENASLGNYIALYVDADRSKFLKTAGADYEWEFVPYDWSLNDQNPVTADKR